MDMDKHGQKHYQSTVKEEHGEHGGDDEESEIIRRINLNERLAEEMSEDGIDCEAVEVSSLPLEQKPYYSHNFAMSSKFITNRGCLRVKGRGIDLVQVIQRN